MSAMSDIGVPVSTKMAHCEFTVHMLPERANK